MKTTKNIRQKKIAIIGSGISGMSCAYYLKDDFEISIFEKNEYLGGHTHTHTIEEGGKELKIDSGFMVFNIKTYPNLLNLFDELGVEKQKTDMSFGVYNKNNGLQYSGNNFSTLFSQKKNIFSVKFWRLLFDINKFFKIAKRDIEKIKGSNETIESYCKRNHLSNYFIDNYLAPMSSAVWSVPHTDIYKFPISLLIPFFYNHGLLGINEPFQWYTVKGGSSTYIDKIINSSNFDVHLDEGAVNIEEKNNVIELKTNKNTYNFDYVILACHSNDSIKIYKNIPKRTKELLTLFEYNKNKAVLHNDESSMPTIKKAWSSWNQIISKKGEKGTTVYWMNKLQKYIAKKQYFVSINPFDIIRKDSIIKEMDYEHPHFTVENFNAQKTLQEINFGTKVLFAGAYFGYGFHEDGIKSGLEVVKILKTKK